MDNKFKKEIMSLIKESEATFGIAITDLESKNIFLYNADEVFPAASIIKIPVLIELFRQVQSKRISLKSRVELKKCDKVGGSGVLQFLDDKLKPTILDLAKLMIIISDNTATNMVIDIIGMDRVNKMMRQLGAVKTVLGRKLHVDPNTLVYKNFATPRDIMLLLEKIYNKDFLLPKYKDVLINIMLDQQYNDKISLNFPPDIKFAHKTGEVSSARGDAGIVVNINKPFIAVVLTKEVKDAKRADEVIAGIGDITLRHWGG